VVEVGVLDDAGLPGRGADALVLAAFHRGGDLGMVALQAGG
jgi:hypothetical protein